MISDISKFLHYKGLFLQNLLLEVYYLNKKIASTKESKPQVGLLKKPKKTILEMAVFTVFSLRLKNIIF